MAFCLPWEGKVEKAMQCFFFFCVIPKITVWAVFLPLAVGIIVGALQLWVSSENLHFSQCVYHGTRCCVTAWPFCVGCLRYVLMSLWRGLVLILGRL